MKPDVLTITAIVFAAGVLISSLGITENLDGHGKAPPPTALQQGITTR